MPGPHTPGSAVKVMVAESVLGVPGSHGLSVISLNVPLTGFAVSKMRSHVSVSDPVRVTSTLVAADWGLAVIVGATSDRESFAVEEEEEHPTIAAATTDAPVRHPRAAVRRRFFMVRGSR